MAQINLRVNDAVKAKAENACSAMGLTMSSAINIFLIKVGNERRIPFKVSADPFYSEANMNKLKKSIADLNAGKGTMHEVDCE